MAAKIRRSKKEKKSKDKLIEASKHLFWGMRYLSERLQFILMHTNSMGDDEIQGVLNSIHESFLIHSRKMSDFLFDASTYVYEDDVIAQDYFADYGHWKEIQPPLPSVIRDTRKNVGKLLAHFTYSMVERRDGRTTWKTSDIYVEIYEALQIFLRNVDSSLLDDRVELLRSGNPKIVICHPIYPPEAKSPYQIACVRDLASGFELTSDE